MDFGWTPAEQDLRERTLQFVRRIDPEVDRAPEIGLRRLGEYGFLGLSLPEDLGGMGLGALATAGVVEAVGFGLRDTGVLFSACAHLFACAVPIAEFGDARLKRSIVPRLASGAAIGANAITEAEAGSDVFALRTTAVRDGETYVLNGVKTYVTNAPIADVFLVYAVTNARLGFFGLTAFAVEKGTPGLQIGKPFDKVGLGSAPTSSLYLESCRVPEGRRVGEEGQGAVVFGASMGWERACLFAAYVGVMQRDVERAVAFAKERKQFGRSIGTNQGISHRIANMQLRLDAARLLLYRACWLKDAGQNSGVAISLAKLAISEAAVQSGLDLVQIHGSLGVSREARLHESLLNALPSTIFSGTSEIQRDLIAKGLGL